MSMPTIPELDECLKDVVRWERFAIYLPEMEHTDIEMIKMNKRDVADQKLGLYETWLQVCPSASWDDVIQALEKVRENTLASKLRAKFPLAQAAMSPIQGQAHEEVSNELSHVHVSKDVVVELEKLHTDFVSLTKEVRSEVKREVEDEKMSVEDLVEHVEEQKAYDIEFQQVQTIDQFFQAIRPHYSFLDCYLIISLTVLLSDYIAHKAKQYRNSTEQFMRETSVATLHKQLDQYFQRFQYDTRVRVTVALENAWGKQSMWLVKQLIQQFFGLEHSDQCQWFRIRLGSLFVTFSAPKRITECHNKNDPMKLQFMGLLGVISIQVEYSYIMMKESNDFFSFEDSLIKAAVENNVEAVQFLLQHAQVNVNVQPVRFDLLPPLKDEIFKTELTTVEQLEEFHTIFTSLMKDIEFELEHAIEIGQITMQNLPKSIYLRKKVETIGDIVPAIKVSCSIFNCHILVSLAPLLPDSFAQKVSHYSNQIEWFKTETNMFCLKEKLLQKFRTVLPNSVSIIVILENAWFSCSMWFVEELLKSIFSPTDFSVFHWFYVITGSVHVVFLAPLQLMWALYDNSRKRRQFMSLTGVISLKIEDLNVFEKSKHSEYSFIKGIEEAKRLGSTDAVHFLLQISQAPLGTKNTTLVDMNNNYHFIPEPDSTALMISCCNDNTQLMRLLLDYHADPNIETRRKFTALMYAVSNSLHFKMLQDHGANVNMANMYKENVLHRACNVGNVEVVKMLLRNSPGLIDKRVNSGETPLHIACIQGHLQVAIELLQAQAKTNTSSNNGATPLHAASNGGYSQIVKHLLQANADPDIQDDKGATPLHEASCSGNLQAAMELLQAKANPNRPDLEGRTPLYIASHKDHLQIAEQLLQAQAIPDIPSNDGDTPLYIACYNGHQTVVQCLLQAKASLGTLNNGETPLHGASCKGHLHIVEQLLQAKADPNVTDSKGNTPLYMASNQGYSQVVHRLLQAQADPNISNDDQETPLYTASCNGFVDVVKQLLKGQADPDIRARKGATALYAASDKNFIQIVEELLQEGADPDIPNKDEITPLSTATRNNYIDLVKLLLLVKADPNISNKLGRTPLHIAVKRGNSEIVSHLLQAKADFNIRDCMGRKPFDGI